MTLAAGTRLGPYEILSPLGAGGMGEVYRARDERLKREVAVKVLPASFSSDPERLRRFEQEAQAAGSLNHPNILAIHDIGMVEGAPYIVSELLDGETLRERLSAGALPARKAIDYAVQIAHGLAAAHEKGIVHRDLKPENLFVTRDGRVKILDFGLAKLTQPESGARELTELPTAAAATEPGVVLGTLGYMSPEQVRGKPADVRSDIFAFGAVLYEMLSGKRAFHGESAADTLSAILTKEPPDLSETGRAIPPGLERVVRHCLEKNAEERFHSAHDLAFDLQALSVDSGPAPRTAAGRPGSLAARKIPLAWAGAAVVAALVLAGTAGVLLSKKSSAVPSAFRKLTFRRGLVWSARFAPDGQTVLYGGAWDGAPVELFSTRPESPESRSLGLGSADILSISSSGEMAVSLNRHFLTGWENSGTLAQVPLSGGAPREILENVSEADWAPDGRSLAIAYDAGGKNRLEFPIGKVLYETPGWVSQIRVRPQGDRVAFIDHVTRGDNAGSLCVVDMDGKKTMLVELGGQGLAWSPSGKEIWFSAGGTLRAVSLSGADRVIARVPGGLWVEDIARDGRVLMAHTAIRREIAGLSPGEVKERNLSWLDWSFPIALSADGRVVLFEEQNRVTPDGGYAVYSRKTDGSPAVRLGDGNTLALSPDGRWALAVLRPSSDGQLFLMPVGAGQARNLPRDAVRYQPWGAWLPDGKRFLVAGTEPGHGTRLYLRDLESAKARLATPGEIRISFTGITVSPDGKSATAISANGTVSIISLESGQARQIPGLAEGELPVQWSDDGRALYVSRPQGLPAKVFRLDLVTGERSLWKEIAPSDAAGVFGIEPIRLTRDGKAYVYSYRRLLTDLYLVEGLK
jgi:eukaryotic-like serine/threonine-protein kinase